MKQLSFDKKIVVKTSREFGGSLNLNLRKSARPLSHKHAIHLVLKADTTKSGSLLKFKSKIIASLHKYSKHFDIQVYKKAVVGNHLHIVLRIPSREKYRAFIRTFTARLVLAFKIKWRLRPYTRILSWGKDFTQVLSYVLQNILEAEGVIAYKPRYKRILLVQERTSGRA